MSDIPADMRRLVVVTILGVWIEKVITRWRRIARLYRGTKVLGPHALNYPANR